MGNVLATLDSEEIQPIKAKTGCKDLSCVANVTPTYHVSCVAQLTCFLSHSF